MIEPDRPFTEGCIDLDDWKRKARNVNAAMRILQNEKRAHKLSRLAALNDKLDVKRLKTALSLFNS